MESSQLHAVVLAFPAHGHIKPILHLAHRLVASGLKITFVTDETHRNLFDTEKAPSGFQFEALPTRLPIIQMIPSIKPKAPPPLDIFDQMEPDLENLLPKLLNEKSPVSCIIFDAFLSVWPLRCAEKFGLSTVAVLTSSATNACFDWQLPELIKQGKLPVECNEDIFSGIPGVPTIVGREVPLFYHKKYASIDPGCKRHIANSAAQSKASMLAVNSFEALEPEAFEALRKNVNRNCVGIGPMLGSAPENPTAKTTNAASMWSEESHCLDWLESRENGSVIYIALGSLAVFAKDQFEEFAKGLEASGQGFLWALRPGSVSNMSEEFYKGFTERTKNQGLVVSWAPQLEVLSHESVGGFLSHCGWGSVLESIYCGKALLCWPNFADQNLNCKVVVDELNNGLKFVDTSPGSENNGEDGARSIKDEVEVLIRRFMKGKEGEYARQRALKIRDMALAAISQGGTSFGGIQEVATMNKSHMLEA